MMSLTGCTPCICRRRHRRHGPPLFRVLAVGCGLVLGGCAALCDEYTDDYAARSARRAPTAESATFAARKAALLRPPRTPACETGPADKPSGDAPIATNAVLALRIKLEYERECYRQAERRVRAQLLSLQALVADATKAHGAPASATAGGPSASP